MQRQLMARLAVLLAIAGSLVVLGPASPANAFIGLYRVDAISANNANSPKTVTVGCTNAGDQILSVGGMIDNGFGDVLLTRAYVNSALTVATAAGIEAIPTAVNWTVRVFAVCVPAGTVANLQLIEDTDGPNANDKFPIAYCPAGTSTFGGGYRLEDAFGLVAVDELAFDPIGLGYVRAVSYNYGAVGNYSFTVQAICGNPVPDMYLETWTSANNSITPKTGTTNACNANTQVSAVGTIITGALGNASIATLNPRPQLTAGESTVREIGNYANSWTSQVQALCVG